MTVSTEVSHNEYTGNGVTTTFPYTFRVLKKNDLVVQTLDMNDNITTLVMDTSYTVTGVGSYSGGSIILTAPLANGWRITIDRELDVVQETDLRNQGKFFAEVHENAFDYLTMLIQQCFAWTRLALLKPNFLAKYYDAKQNKISNLADPAAEQDAVNNRSMRSYVDAAIAGVVGGFGWFIQYGAGAVYRTFQDKMRDTVSVKDFGAIGDGVNDDTAAFVAASNSLAEGGTLLVPSGTWRVVGPVNIKPVNIIGQGQGKSVIAFDNSGSSRDGFVFSAPTKDDIELGAQRLSIKTVGGNGGSAFFTPRGVGLNYLRPKPTFLHLAFCSESAGSTADEFAQTYGWEWLFNCGDSWQFTIERIDAAGCYQASQNFTSQFLDGFIRTAPEQGILSMRVSDVTTHNVANFFEIKQKTYFSLTNIDAARALNGVYDAPDRVFETNRYAYGESIWTNVIINAQLNGVNLENRFLLVANGLAIHRAAGCYDHGQEWVGLKLTRSRICTLQGLEISSASGYTGGRKGIMTDGGDANNFSNVSFGSLDVGAQIGVTGSAYGASQAVNFSNVSINASVGTLFNVQNARRFNCNGYGASSGWTPGNLLVNDDTANNTITLSNIAGANEYTDNSIYWVNQAAPTDGKRWRFDTTNGLTLGTQTDTGAAGNNALIIARNGTLVDRVELRTRATAGGYIQMTAPETQFSGLIKPTADNVNSNGTAPFRWSQVYAGAGSINTSDEDDKYRMTADEQTREAEHRAALEIKADMWRFKFRESAAEKGQENARIHFGVGAQSVGDILRKHGLDPQNYAFWCYDEWDDIYEPEMAMRSVTNEDTGESWEEEYATGRQVIVKKAGGKYGIRYEELLCFIIAAM